MTEEADSLEGQIFLGKAEDLLPKLKRDSVDFIFADPPYNVSRKNNLHTMGREGIEFKWDGGFDQETWVRLALPALRPGGHIVIWNDWGILGFLRKLLGELEVEGKRPIIWRKTNPAPRNRERVFVVAQEFAIWGTKKVRRNLKWTFNRHTEKGYERGEFDYALPEDGNPLEIDASIQRSFHAAKKPDALVEEIIQLLTNPGDLVLDPFSGEGTVALACERIGRRHISSELDPKNHAYAVAALNALRQNMNDDLGAAIGQLPSVETVCSMIGTQSHDICDICGSSECCQPVGAH